MSDIKTKVQGLNPSVTPRNIGEMVDQTSNIYESLAVISKRARQLSMDLKQELHSKLDEFASTTDAIEEISENKEQIEISKFYERLPNPVLIATEEYLEHDLYFRNKEKREDF